jgi:hypothetical protein
MHFAVLEAVALSFNEAAARVLTDNLEPIEVFAVTFHMAPPRVYSDRGRSAWCSCVSLLFRLLPFVNFL